MLEDRLKVERGIVLAFSVLNAESSAAPLVLICGMSATCEDWRGVQTLWARERPVLIFDNRGLGESSATESYAFGALASDVYALITHLGWGRQRPVHILGHSMGGMIALTFEG